MKNILILLLGLVLLSPVQAQKNNKARAYFKTFQSESRKISRKNYIYLEATVKGSDPRRINRYREMVVEQMKESKKAVQRVKEFNGDDVLKREYLDGLDMYIKAFGEQFAVADSLSAFKYNSFDDLIVYYTRLEEAEQTMIDAARKIEKAEGYFAKTYRVSVRVDEEALEQYRILDEVSLFARDMTEVFFRVDAQVQDYLGAATRGNMDSLPLIIKNMRGAINKSKEELAGYTGAPEGNRLQRDVEYYLEDMEEELNVKLIPTAEALGNVYLEEKEYKYAQRDLEDFVERNQDYREDFFASRQYLIEDYLPEK